MRLLKNIRFLLKYDVNKCFFEQSKELSELTKKAFEMKQIILEQNQLIAEIASNLKLDNGRK